MFSKDLGDYEFDPQKRTSGLHEFVADEVNVSSLKIMRYRKR